MTDAASPPAPDGPPLIEARNVSVRREGVPVLEHVDLALRPREIVTLIGLNGAGKSTLVRALLGIIPVSEGEIRRRPGLRVGYAPQQIARDATLPLTVARMLSLAAPARADRIAEVLAEVGAEGLGNRPFHALSGGETHRVLLARALLRDPELLVLDEPVAGVDVAGQAALYHLIADLRERRGLAVLLVSHDLHLVMARTDRVICLNGHVCCTGSAREVVGHPAFRALFGDHVAHELAFYVHSHDHEDDVHGHVVTQRGADGGGAP
ncbi:MAG: metal ABC transporter ATP-binding protein [Alphaproteobacteria bacterium]|nr:metal ABC transporter ATP-binding protein [Alphaproteobacteria bacterium]